jgi:formate-dependent nitrite reductase membrane component NrfD
MVKWGRMDTNQKAEYPVCSGWFGCRRCTAFIGIFLVVVGALFLIEDLGWLPLDVSVWTIGLIAFGLYLLGSGVKH